MPVTCSRKACPVTTDKPWIHKHLKKPYCIRCARKINEYAKQELCSPAEEPKVDKFEQWWEDCMTKKGMVEIPGDGKHMIMNSFGVVHWLN